MLIPAGPLCPSIPDLIDLKSPAVAADRRLPMRYRPLRRLITVGIMALPIPLSDAIAQEAPPRKSEIRGVVLRSETRAPVIRALVSLEGTEHVVSTDKEGRFKFPRVAAGEYMVRAEIEGSPTATITVTVKQDDRMEVEFLLDADPSLQMLPAVEVTAEQPVSPIAVFNRRMHEGNGRYFTREDIQRRNPATLMDLLRLVPGVRVSCPRNLHSCVLRLRRAMCDPGYYLNGMPANASVLFLTTPIDVEGIEVYTGAAETPIELEGLRSACGAIVIWTRVAERNP